MSMEFRLVAYGNRVRANQAGAVIHGSVTICVPMNWLQDQMPQRKKRGLVLQRALSNPCCKLPVVRPASFSKVPARNSPEAADSIPARNNTGTDDTAGGNSRCAVAALAGNPPGSPDETPVARAPWKSSPAVWS